MVFQYFSQRRPFGTAHDQNFFWGGMREKRGMNKGFVKDEFVDLGRLDSPVQKENLAEQPVMNAMSGLIPRCFLKNEPVNQE
jgi:hypothetical protein